MERRLPRFLRPRRGPSLVNFEQVVLVVVLVLVLDVGPSFEDEDDDENEDEGVSAANSHRAGPSDAGSRKSTQFHLPLDFQYPTFAQPGLCGFRCLVALLSSKASLRDDDRRRRDAVKKLDRRIREKAACRNLDVDRFQTRGKGIPGSGVARVRGFRSPATQGQLE